ncbi:HPr family phosphocarrier protein [Clostridium sp. KNHs205]|jgi:phosphocarrier protein|uniref:HPr family phosphocarrier protein n=1 Tax=Clostridium sp. KNHs205 TaxID=1449050 RepID=UPI00051B0A8F|nr:HPr family phosphocarrier protein [Clostridium sp. KNHs205]
MKEIKYIITDPEGIHARPAGEMVKLLKEFKSTVTISKDGKSTDAKRIFGVMGLGAKQGQEIQLIVEGEDEAKAIAALDEFLKKQL